MISVVNLDLGTREVVESMIKKIEISPSFPCMEKKEFFAIFSETVSFIIKILEKKIVDHKLIYKKCIYTFFLRATVFEIFAFEKLFKYYVLAQ